VHAPVPAVQPPSAPPGRSADAEPASAISVGVGESG
jgi:hypothetical protein